MLVVTPNVDEWRLDKIESEVIDNADDVLQIILEYLKDWYFEFWKFPVTSRERKHKKCIKTQRKELWKIQRAWISEQTNKKRTEEKKGCLSRKEGTKSIVHVGFWRVEIVWTSGSSSLVRRWRLLSSYETPLLNQQLTYGRLVSPLNYIRIGLLSGIRLSTENYCPPRCRNMTDVL